MSKVGFGCMGMTAFYGPPLDDEQALVLLREVYKAGCTHFDTAELYRAGKPYKYNESVVGRFVREVPRDSLTVATKFMPPLHKNKCDFDTVNAALDASLQRLGLSFVDVYYCHRMPPSLAALQEWMRSVSRLVALGKVKYVGLSEVSPSLLRAAYQIFPISCIQQEWSLATRGAIEEALVPLCRELKIGIVCYSPLARGLLTERIGDVADKGDWRAKLPRFSGQNIMANELLMREVVSLGQKVRASASQLTLAWLFRQAETLGVSVCPIPGSTNLEHVLNNLDAAHLELTLEDFEKLSELGLRVVGARHTQDYTKMALEGLLQR